MSDLQRFTEAIQQHVRILCDQEPGGSKRFSE